jgi:hypothetical protein
MTIAKKILLLALLTLTWANGLAQVDIFYFNFTGTNGGAIGDIPQNDPLGLIDARNIGSSNVFDYFSANSVLVTNVILTLNFTGDSIGNITGYIRLGDETNSPAFFFNPDSSLYSVTFMNFNDYSAKDIWTLFLADNSPIGQNTLDSWSLSIYTVPEPSEVALLAVNASVLLLFMLRRSKSGKPVLHR